MKEPEKEELNPELLSKLGELVSLVNNFKIVGEGISGSFREGYKLDSQPEESTGEL